MFPTMDRASLEQPAGAALTLLLTFVCGLGLACAGDDSSGSSGSACIGGQFCPGTQICVDGVCVDGGMTGETSGGDGDGDTTTTAGATGDGDGDATTTTSGDGDGDPTTTTSGDGDGDPTTTTTSGDGDGDPTGDGDGDGTTTGEPGPNCGWNANTSYYYCESVGEDPDGVHAIECPGGAAIADLVTMPCDSVSPTLTFEGCCESNAAYWCENGLINEVACD